jgi:hypothetical protein
VPILISTFIASPTRSLAPNNIACWLAPCDPRSDLRGQLMQSNPDVFTCGSWKPVSGHRDMERPNCRNASVTMPSASRVASYRLGPLAARNTFGPRRRTNRPHELCEGGIDSIPQQQHQVAAVYCLIDCRQCQPGMSHRQEVWPRYHPEKQFQPVSPYPRDNAGRDWWVCGRYRVSGTPRSSED